MADFNPYEVPSAAVVDVMGPVCSLVNVCFIFRDDRRCIHDLMADTIVVRIRT